ncbi:MAG: NAD(P)H-dependent oxidoreductase [Methanocellales archaeon]|nr:NAD(P)H-dependent oxidoreductase [Methanocellales archaeon]MDD3292067.1 NAD(P)H-dependent oxidoreductase [Methanocellales archaeon]MDD5235552.1 NAD(P)H-dependent oxidoreductase [Methanocellales archaeon]MDD5485576.1 NAD(P)H-dependent oxidoreductase [Methanocellales archaeon]
MKVLAIIASPKPKSFSHAILESFTKGLKEAGNTFDALDLREIEFDPVMRLEDVAQFKGARMPEDILAQQEKVSQADALAFFSPIYWGNLPAILVGWFQRVLSLGFAYRPPSPGEMGPQGLLPQKKAIIFNTAMAMGKLYKDTGLEDAIKKIFDEYMLKSCGIQNVEHIFFYGVPLVSDKVRKGYLEEAYKLGKEF